MAMTDDCDTCVHTVRCRFLLGLSYREHGPCDWEPSRYVQRWLQWNIMWRGCTMNKTGA